MYIVEAAIIAKHHMVLCMGTDAIDLQLLYPCTLKAASDDTLLRGLLRIFLQQKGGKVMPDIVTVLGHNP